MSLTCFIMLAEGLCSRSTCAIDRSSRISKEQLSKFPSYCTRKSYGRNRENPADKLSARTLLEKKVCPTYKLSNGQAAVSARNGGE
jgi:hypothetical protein